MIHPRLPITYHRKFIGTGQIMTETLKNGKKRVRLGHVVDVQRVDGRITDVRTGEMWHVIELTIKPDKRGRKPFTMRFADRKVKP